MFSVALSVDGGSGPRLPAYAATGKLLLPGAKITWDIHYSQAGEEITNQVEMGIYFYPKGQEPKYRTSLSLVPAALGTMDIRSFWSISIKENIPADQSIIIVGDRRDVQQRAIELGPRPAQFREPPAAGEDLVPGVHPRCGDRLRQAADPDVEDRPGVVLVVGTDRE